MSEEMFRTVKASQVPSGALFNAELPRFFAGELKQEFNAKDICRADIPVLFSPSTRLTPYSNLFLKISNRNLS